MNKKNKIDMLFVFLPGGLFQQEINHHLGAAYIQAYLKKHGFSSAQLKDFVKENDSLETITQKVVKINPRVIGFTCYDSNLFITKRLAAKLKKKNKNWLILAGGPTASFLPEHLLEKPGIDLCVRFDGEITVCQLLKTMKKKSKLTVADFLKIKGIAFKKNNKLIITPKRTLKIEQKFRKENGLDYYPSPYLEGILTGQEHAGVCTSRGCSFNCIYCSFSGMSNHKTRYHSIDRVIAELKIIEKTLGSQNALTPFNDDTFSHNLIRAKKLCQKIIEEKIKLNLWCETRTDCCDKELLDLMKQANFRQVTFGLESAVPKVLKKARKTDNPEKFLEQAKEMMAYAKKIGLDVTVSIVLGLPGETLADGLKTIDFVKKLKVRTYKHNLLNLWSGSELFKQAKKYGYVVKENQGPFGYPFKTTPKYKFPKVPELEKTSHVELLDESLLKNCLANNLGARETAVFLENGFELNKFRAWAQDELPLIIKALFLQGIKNEGIILPAQTTIDLDEKIRTDCSKPLNYQAKNCFSDKKIDFVLSPFSKGKLKNRPGLLITPTKKDVKAFTKFLEKNSILFESAGRPLRLAASKDAAPAQALVDGCRWESKDCLKKCFSRLIVSGNSLVKFCFQGKPMGRVGEPLETIKGWVAELWQAETTKRGCQKCKVKNYCAKCLFPRPLTAKEYCAIKKRFTSTQLDGVCLSD